MALVEPNSSQLGQRLDLSIRGQLEPATVVELPFYSRPKAGG